MKKFCAGIQLEIQMEVGGVGQGEEMVMFFSLRLI